MTYSPVAAATRIAASTTARRSISSSSDFGSLNVSPALSPDGRMVAFLSQRDLFSIDLFVADAETGQVVRKLTQDRGRPAFHQPRVHQLGRRLGARQPPLRLLGDHAAARRSSSFRTSSGTRRSASCGSRTLGRSSAWRGPRTASSSSSRRTAAGFTDLYLYDLQSEHAAQADLRRVRRPAAGLVARRHEHRVRDRPVLDRPVAAVHRQLPDRPGGSRRRGSVRPLPGLDKGKNTNPQWAPDGRTMLFLSDRTGITNLYRYDLDVRRRWRSSPTSTRASAGSPLSARRCRCRPRPGAPSTPCGRRATTTSTRSTARQGGHVVTSSPPLNAAVLPPVVRVESIVAAVNADEKTGLPAPARSSSPTTSRSSASRA